jgi:hypothetical protein
MFELGHSLPSHSALVLINVCCSPKSDQIAERHERREGPARDIELFPIV